MKKTLAAGLVSVSLIMMMGVASADENQELAKKNGCFGCHAIGHVIVGPAWNDVSAKYKNDPDAEKKLTHSILTGSSGKWGTKVHMKANNLPPNEAATLARYILSLKK